MAERSPDIVIVGAGPAGLRAAITLAKAGLCPTLIDEQPRVGGQIFRQPPAQPGFSRDRNEIYGEGAGRAAALFADFERLRPSIDYRPSTLAYDLLDRQIFATDESGQISMPWDCLILATGATDRIYPCPGWTLPGVFSLGGAQIALKHQGCAIGRKAVFAGAGPLLFLTAYQYARAGAPPKAIVTTTSRRNLLRALSHMARMPGAISQGVKWIVHLLANRVPFHFSARLVQIIGDERVKAVVIESNRAKRRQIDCDAVAIGHGLRSECQLAELAGANFRYDESERQFLPERDQFGRIAGLKGVYIAGDGAGIGGSIAAEAAGRLAASAVLDDYELANPLSERSSDLQVVRQWRNFQSAMRAAFPDPDGLAEAISDQTIVCRCELVTAQDLRLASSIRGCDDMNMIKAFTRLGMGRCQGRMCVSAGSEIVAAAQKRSIKDVGRLRCQAPIKPVPIDVFANISNPS